MELKVEKHEKENIYFLEVDSTFIKTFVNPKFVVFGDVENWKLSPKGIMWSTKRCTSNDYTQ